MQFLYYIYAQDMDTCEETMSRNVLHHHFSCSSHASPVQTFFLFRIDQRQKSNTHPANRITHMKTTGNMKMKLARIEIGLSQQDLADRVEVTRQTIGLIESGNYNPTLNLCVRIARTLGKTLDQLFWEDEKDE
jgi:putative transcriptional regulator